MVISDLKGAQKIFIVFIEKINGYITVSFFDEKKTDRNYLDVNSGIYIVGNALKSLLIDSPESGDEV